MGVKVRLNLNFSYEGFACVDRDTQPEDMKAKMENGLLEVTPSMFMPEQQAHWIRGNDCLPLNLWSALGRLIGSLSHACSHPCTRAVAHGLFVSTLAYPVSLDCQYMYFCQWY